MESRLTETFLSLFCEKNSDGTRKLRLKGNELQKRIGVRLSEDDMYKISIYLEFHETITYLDLSYNYFGDEGLRVLCENLFAVPNNLRYLNLFKCTISAYGVEHLVEANLAKLETLRLGANKLGYDACRTIAKILKNCPSLTYLDLGNTRQTLESVELITLRCRELKILNISRIIPYSYYYQYDTMKLADVFSYFVETSKMIVELCIQKNQLDGHDIESLLYGLKVNKSLKMLDLAYNQIGDYGLEVLSDWLKTRPSLLGLNVVANKITSIGATALSFGIPFSKLRLLNIARNNIEEVGIIDLLNSIKKPYFMRMLHIWGNKFGHKANKIIERMLLSTTLDQQLIDVRLYCVDDVLHAAYHHIDHFKQRYYGVMDYGWPPDLKIHRNKIVTKAAKPRALIDFVHVDRYPPVEDYGEINQISQLCAPFSCRAL